MNTTQTATVLLTDPPTRITTSLALMLALTEGPQPKLQHARLELPPSPAQFTGGAVSAISPEHWEVRLLANRHSGRW